MRSIQEANEQVIKQLSDQKWIDERIYVSCLPEARALRALNIGTLDDEADAQFLPDPNHEKAKVKFEGLGELKKAILSNKKMHTKPKKVILKN